jgi:hypothetical protein
MEGAKKGRERLGDDLPECEPTAPRVRAKRAHHAHRQFERNGDCRFDGRDGGAQCGGLFEVAVRLAFRQGKLVLELSCRIRYRGLLIEKPIGGVHQSGFVRLCRSHHVT